MNTESELERFSRIWDEDCQKVNAGKFDIIKALFLATVDDEIRENVDAELSDYRDLT